MSELLKDFQTGTASMASKRHLASNARGFCGFCLMARLGVQKVHDVQDVQKVQDVQMVQGVQKVQGVQLRPIRILLARMKEHHASCPFTEQLDFYISIHFF